MMLLHSDSEANHQEHELLLGQLQELESALDGLVCYAEVYTDLGTAAQVYQSGAGCRTRFHGTSSTRNSQCWMW